MRTEAKTAVSGKRVAAFSHNLVTGPGKYGNPGPYCAPNNAGEILPREKPPEGKTPAPTVVESPHRPGGAALPAGREFSPCHRADIHGREISAIVTLLYIAS
jgi:hypothetical protein